MARPKQPVIEYRSYELPPDFPMIALTGDQWHISPVPSKRLHFHNCLEIGVCHSESGTMVLGSEQRAFRSGFVTCIALARRGRPVLVVEGKAEGMLLRAPAGENGFGYDPYFFYPPLHKSFAELTAQEKNSVSHRRAALDALRKALDAENTAR